MNKIVIDSNKLNSYCDNNIEVKDGIIRFLCGGDYSLEFIDCSDIDINIIIKDNICVKLFIIGIDNDINSKIMYKLGNNSNLILFKFYNNKNVCEYEEVYLEGSYSKVSYNFSSICRGKEEYKIKIFHNNNYVSSYVSNKCIGNDGSKISFDIDSILDKGNIGCSMDQNTKVMCMGDVDCKVEPNMYIEEDDVEARHGSVIGKFSDECIFYLMSRGISEDEAIKLLIKGFILSNLVVDDDKRDRILDIINYNYGN